jgi:putative hydrolase
MARAGRALGHEYMVLTDHSPRLTVANGLSPERLREQLDVVAGLNDALAAEAEAGEAAPFRLLTGIECDILEDGSLDQEPALLARLDLVVASVHSKLRMARDEMTARMVAAISNPHTDGSATAPAGRWSATGAAARAGRRASSTPSWCSPPAPASTWRWR